MKAFEREMIPATLGGPLNIEGTEGVSEDTGLRGRTARLTMVDPPAGACMDV